jgi:type IV pilus assembly protein PilW
MQSQTSQRTQRGFTLVELMVALLLGVVLTSGVISVFITSKSSYSLNNAVGQVQEGGRYALTTMEPLVSMAGFSGCTSPTSPAGGAGAKFESILPGSADPAYDFSYPVYGFEFTGTGPGDKVVDTGTPVVDTTATDWSPSISAAMQTAIDGYSPVKNSDMFMVHEELGNPAILISPYDSGGTTLTYYASTTTPPVALNDIAIVSSCIDIDVFQASSSNMTAGANGTMGHGTFINSYTSSGGNVGKAQTYLFFVGKGVDGGYSLYEVSLASGTGQLGTPEEIVPGVENMQVLYGVNANSSLTNAPSNYQTADTVQASGQWAKVVSVRIALMVRSDDDAIDKSMTPTAVTGMQMLGVGFSDAMTYYPAADRRIHRYFVETISLRNSIP